MQNSTYQYLLYLHQKQCQWVLSADHMVACNTSNPHHTQSPQSDVQYATQHCHGAAKSFLINNAFSTMIKLSIASLITHLLAYMAYTGCIAEWMAFAWRHFAHKKQYKKSTHYEVLSMAMSPYSMFINDIIIKAVNVHGKNQKICGQITAKKPAKFVANLQS